MQPTADFQDQLTAPRLPQAAGVVHHATAGDAAGDVRHTPAAAGEAPMRGFLGAPQGPSSRVAGRPAGGPVVPGERQAAQVLEHPAACGPGRRRGLGPPLLLRAPRLGRTPKAEGERRLDPQPMWHRGACLRAAITARLRRRLLGTREAPCGAIVAHRGAAGGAPGGDGSWRGSTTAVASASATPRRCASSGTDRVGVSPSGRRVARRTTQRR